MEHAKIHESQYWDSPLNFHVAKRGDELHVELTYPPREGDPPNPAGPCRYVVVDQESVRASDGVRLHYDYQRDGLVIEQASRFAWARTGDCDPDWQEVAFVQSWARAETPEEEEKRLMLEAPDGA
jgi:hypothetical protein